MYLGPGGRWVVNRVVTRKKVISMYNGPEAIMNSMKGVPTHVGRPVPDE